MVEEKLWEPDEIIVHIEPGAKVLFLLAIILPLGLTLLEYGASTPYEIYTRGETQRMKNSYRVGFGASGLEVCGSSKDQLFVVNVKTESVSNISVEKYTLKDNGYLRNDSEFFDIAELDFVSCWRFAVRVTPTIDGNVFFTFTLIDIDRTNNLQEWHNSYCFFLLCIITGVVEMKTIGVIRDVRYN